MASKESIHPAPEPSGETYRHSDLVLSMLALPDPCDISVEISGEHVALHVGPRDWVWDRRTGELVDAGTDLRDARFLEEETEP